VLRGEDEDRVVSFLKILDINRTLTKSPPGERSCQLKKALDE
jgi:hypothetical protein